MELIIWGDFNAFPTNAQKYRPLWIARKAGLDIADAGKGTFGNIDFAIHNKGLRQYRQPHRSNQFGSDHDLVTWVFSGVLGGTWNCLGGERKASEVVDNVVAIFRIHGLRYLCMQEVTPSIRAELRARGFAVSGGGENIIATLKGRAKVERPRFRVLSATGWPLERGGWHSPATGSSAVIDGKLKVWSVHLPNFERSKWHDLAYKQAATRLVLEGKRFS